MPPLSPTPIESLAAVLFGLAVLHTFSVKRLEVLAHRRPDGTPLRNVLELLGEVEVVFGLWAGVLLVGLAFLEHPQRAIDLLEGKLPDRRLDFTEPAFVFAIMTMAASRPVIEVATRLVRFVAKRLPVPDHLSFFATALVLGPLLGGFITGPAAMTVTALILKRRFFDHGLSERFSYAIVGTLFVNVSIGGTLTNFAAPPVLMVARTWSWDVGFMLGHFGWKAAIAVVINAATLTFLFRRELAGLADRMAHTHHPVDPRPVPIWLIVAHLAIMAGVVFYAHHMVVFLGLLLFFLGVVDVTGEFQDELKLREALLVAFFLGGLVVLGSFQRWWLQPLISGLDSAALFLGTASLTAVTDNAALTYLGSQVDGMALADRYALVAGAVAGGGLTVIANAPNPAGYGILKDNFGADGISPIQLLIAAAAPTLVVLAAFWFLPHFGS
ncbi:MAG: hypothetical protein RIT45_472 [Pseudomonadota bacterium]